MTRPAAPNHVSFSIRNLEAWAPGVTTAPEWHEWARGHRTIEIAGEPALQQMPPMLRRHAGRLGRLACSPAYDTLGDLRDVPMVFSARYGDVSRSVDLLSALSAGEELSPTAFGLSVHNAVPGLFSMARKETANSISLAAGDDCAELGVIEACGLLSDGAEQVLLVVADCPLPAIYHGYADTEPLAYGWSCLISRPTVDILTVKWSDSVSIFEATAIRTPGPLAVVPILLGLSNDLVRQSIIGQNDDSDPNLRDSNLAAPNLRRSTIGQNDDSDPNSNRLSSPSHRKRRVWHWSRNA